MKRQICLPELENPVNSHFREDSFYDASWPVIILVATMKIVTYVVS